MDTLTKNLIESYQEDKKNKLSNFFSNDLKGVSYLELVKDLALNGYEIKFIKANTKNKVSLGIDDFRLDQYSYYELTKTKLLIERDKLKLDNYTLENKIKKLKLNKYNKAGQKVFDDKDTIQKIFDSYENEWTLEKIADKLNELSIKTKRGGKWYKSTIKYILENREYVRIGYITEKQFELVQKRKL